ncbi:hypothetical protein E2C01_086162 [Portunus trituberculatus]|uniref:Uncharacterized protein n=1 Tax=Portunus trituberculatus TaxID=210409 RepID=A0A5B7J8Y0_PORTR|nr:hypothetical protein [Portunus trituberculatus]
MTHRCHSSFPPSFSLHPSIGPFSNSLHPSFPPFFPVSLRFSLPSPPGPYSPSIPPFFPLSLCFSLHQTPTLPSSGPTPTPPIEPSTGGTHCVCLLTVIGSDGRAGWAVRFCGGRAGEQAGGGLCGIWRHWDEAGRDRVGGGLPSWRAHVPTAGNLGTFFPLQDP